MTLMQAFHPAYVRPAGRPNGQAQTAPATGWAPPVDVLDREKEYLLRLDLPGVDETKVKVEYREGLLTVGGERKDDAEPGRYSRRERKAGEFRREFRLPEAIDADGIVARFERGVLEIRIPKAERTRRIPIQ